MTIIQALQWAKKQLESSPTPTLDAEVLLCRVLECDKSKLTSHSEEELADSQKVLFEQFVQERSKGKPVAYITHQKEFFGRNFYVDERVLIPRPETEELVETALEYLKEHPEIETIIDLGTGSGCIAITLALELPKRQVIGLDVSKKSLEVAQINKEKHSCKNLTLLESDLLSDITKALKSLKSPKAPNGRFAILANLPYIGTKTNIFVEPNVAQFEPDQALYGGPDGLDPYRKSWQQIKDLKLTVSAMFMEISTDQAKNLKQEAKTMFPQAKIQIKKDLAGKARIGVLEFD